MYIYMYMYMHTYICMYIPQDYLKKISIKIDLATHEDNS